jgi:hypothetical protein
MTVQVQNIISIIIAVAIAGINAVTALDPGLLDLTPVAVRWLGIAGIMLAALQLAMRQVTWPRLQGKEN